MDMTKKMKIESDRQVQKRKVVIGMSGGVDSSVAAALLVDMGYDVTGMTMKLWHYTSKACNVKEADNLCCSVESIEMARRVARKLGIDYIVVNVEERFKSEIVDDFISCYAQGLTPNPCVICNERIKFGAFRQKAQVIDSDYIATGHYARVEHDSVSQRHILKRANDLSKDQSYMLYRLDQEQLSKAVFPIGELKKTEVRKIAADMGLEMADKPDSQEICFIPQGDYRQFLLECNPELGKSGDIVDESGRILGRHSGTAMYTYGQRKGLGALGPDPMYVVDIVPEENLLVVGNASATESKTLIASDLNFIPFDFLKKDMKVTAKIRYLSQDSPALLIPLDGDTVRVEFQLPQKSITPGQSVVFYDHDVVVGGGIIQRCVK